MLPELRILDEKTMAVEYLEVTYDGGSTEVFIAVHSKGQYNAYVVTVHNNRVWYPSLRRRLSNKGWIYPPHGMKSYKVL